MATRGELAHLLRRATFGPRAEEVDAAERTGYDATLTLLLAPAGTDAGAARTPMPAFGTDPYVGLPKEATREQRQQAQRQERDRIRQATNWWVDRMVAADEQFVEKLTFFWHGHWATSVEKVNVAGLMLRQQDLLRRYGRGDFAVFVKAMLRDPALIRFLDGQRNTRQAPNENLARELMELFTLGIGQYTEDDVKAAARALTGWVVARPPGTPGRAGATPAPVPVPPVELTALFRPDRHDDELKQIFGHTGRYDADSLVDLLMAQPANAEFLARQLWYRFASGAEPPRSTVDRLAGAYRPQRDLTALLHALFTDPEFGGTAGHLVKQPVEWAVGAMRQLGVRPGELPDQQQRQLLGGLDAMGQVPLRPPSVGGWPAGGAWLTTSATQARLRLADVLAGRADPAVLDRLTAVPERQRVDALARLLVVDAFTGRTRAVLGGATGDGRRLIALGLSSPEYAVS